jgi:predicted nucleic acid-binding protein
MSSFICFKGERQMDKLFLDSNIIIDYCWGKYFSDDNKHQGYGFRVFQIGLDGKYSILISNFNLIEVFEHFRDYFKLNRIIKSGFSHREFIRERSKISITEEEEDQIDTMLTEIEEDTRLNFIKYAKFGENFISNIIKYVKYEIDFFDAIHLQMAIDNNCDYIITKDGPFRKNSDIMMKRLFGKAVIKTIAPKKAYEQYR